MNDTDFDRAVQGFYQAASGQITWKAALQPTVDGLSTLVSQVVGMDVSTGGLLFSFDSGAAQPQAMLDYLRTYHRIDPRAALALARPPGVWTSCHHHFDDRFVARDPFFQEWLLPNGGRWVSGTKLLEEGNEVVLWGLNNGPERGPLNEHELGVARRLGGHLAQAMAVYRRRQEGVRRERVAEVVLEQLPRPAIVGDSSMRIRFANQAARQWLDAATVLRDDGGRLCGVRERDHAELMYAVRSLALDNGPGLEKPNHPCPKAVLKIGPRGDDCKSVLFIEAVRSEATMRAFGDEALALIMAYTPAARVRLDAAFVASCFDLTPAESRVAVALAQGLSKDDIARAHHVSAETVRTQIKAVMAKTGTVRQADLVSMLATMPVSRPAMPT